MCHGHCDSQQRFARQLRRAKSSGKVWTPSPRRLRPVSTRLRPVMMTALAMVVGMMPMAPAMGEGGEQNAPARASRHRRTACLQTVATLFFVPTVFSLLHRRHNNHAPEQRPGLGTDRGICQP